MTPDEYAGQVERVARALMKVTEDGGWRDWEYCDEPRQAAFLRMAAAVLADLREAGELRTLEQVGWYCEPNGVALDDGAYPDSWRSHGWVPVYIVREDAAWSACPDCGSDEPGQLRWDGENGCTAGMHHRFHDIVREDTDE